MESNMRGHAGTSSSPRHRQSITSEKDTSKRRSFRSSVSRGAERPFSGCTQDRNSNCKCSDLKIVLVIIVFGAFLTVLRFLAVYKTEKLSIFTSRFIGLRPSLVDQRNEESAADQRYVSHLNIDWDQVSEAVEKLPDRKEYKGIGLLNFYDSDIEQWKQLLPEAEHIVLHLDYASQNITWEALYPEWIDEEEQKEVPTCPTLPKLHPPGKPRIELISVKLPCNKLAGWSRDVARLHLQLAAASLAATAKGFNPVHVILLTDCFPIPNLFTCKELVTRVGNAWLYEPNLNTLREKVQLPVGSCELAVPLKSKDHYSPNAKREAYATILHSADDYVCGAIAAAHSIRMSGSTRDLVILVDESISDYHRGGLEAAGWKLYKTQRIRNPKAKNNAYNEYNYSKFRLWQLTEYDKIIFIDADMIILRNIDVLFEMPEISASGNDATLFNSGVMLIEPSNSTFQLLMDHINEIESYNGGDQGYLNEIFTWWHRIPKHMNYLKFFWEGDKAKTIEMKTRLFGADPPVIYVLHYLGLKPWLCFRDYDCNWNVKESHIFASDVAHKTWWKVHDTMPENLQKFCLLRSMNKAALEWNRRQAEKGNFTDGHWKIKIEDSRLQSCFEDNCSWESMLSHWGEKNGTNNSPPTITPAFLSSA